MDNTSDKNASTPRRSSARGRSDSGGMADTPPPRLYIWRARDDLERPGAYLAALRAPSGHRTFLAGAPGGVWLEERALAPSPLEDLLTAVARASADSDNTAQQLRSWGERWGDADAFAPSRLAPAPWTGDTMAAFDWDALREDGALIGGGSPGTEFMERRMDELLTATTSAPSADEWLRQLVLYSQLAMGDQDVPKRMADQPATTIMGNEETITWREFAKLPPLGRLAVLGMPPLWILLQTRVHWRLEVNVLASSGTLHRRGEKRVADTLAKSARLVRTADTDSLAAVPWLEFFWAVEWGMRLRACPCCGAVFLARDARTGFCVHHSPAPWAEPAAGDAYGRARQRAQERHAPVPTWEQWSASYRPRTHRPDPPPPA